MTVAKLGDTVIIHYIAKSKGELLFDSATLNQPLELTIGDKQVIPAFEKAVVGMKKGEKKTISVPSKLAFGPRLAELISKISKDKLSPNLEVAIGQQLQVKLPDNSFILVTVTDIGKDDITLDANHPLAGLDLTFEINLIDIINQSL